MIQHVWSVLCKSISIDAETNQVSIFDVLESLTVYANPEKQIVLPIQFEIITLWNRTDYNKPAVGKTRPVFCNPEGETKSLLETDIDLSQTPFFRTRLKMQGLPLTIGGRYIFRIELLSEGDVNWTTVTEIPLLIQFQPEEIVETRHNNLLISSLK